MEGIKQVVNTDTFDNGRITWNENDRLLAAHVDRISDEFIQERLTGVIDDVNTVFVTTYEFKPSSTQVWINGIKQKQNIDYTELQDYSGIKFSEAPSNNIFVDELEIAYKKVN